MDALLAANVTVVRSDSFLFETSNGSQYPDDSDDIVAGTVSVSLAGKSAFPCTGRACKASNPANTNLQRPRNLYDVNGSDFGARTALGTYRFFQSSLSIDDPAKLPGHAHHILWEAFMAETFGNSSSPGAPQDGANTEFERSIAPNADSANDATSTLGAKIGEDVNSVKQTVEDVAHKATEKATDVAEQQKSRAAEQIEKMAGALERVGKELQSEDAGAIGDYAAQLGASARQFAEKVKDKNLSQIAGVAEDFGRRQPFAFLGIAAVAGLAASRFLMASNDRTTSSTQTASQSNQQKETYND